MASLALRWIDSAPGGIHRVALVRLLSELPVILRTAQEVASDDDALIVVDPPRRAGGAFARWVREFQLTDRPTVTLRPTEKTTPSDLLIAAFDGLVAQLPDMADAMPFDDALLGLLRREWMIEPQRYKVWYQRALLNAAINNIFDDRPEHAVSQLLTAMELGFVPEELSPSDRKDIAEALSDAFTESEEERKKLEQVQDWLLTK